jgi:hypothetical protein
MGKSKTPDLADWHVSFGTSSRVIRATTLHVQGGAFILTAPYGDILFAAPADKVKFVKRLESGEEPEPDEADPYRAWQGELPASSSATLEPPVDLPPGEPVAVQVDEIPVPPPAPEIDESVITTIEAPQGRKRGERGRFAR